MVKLIYSKRYPQKDIGEFIERLDKMRVVEELDGKTITRKNLPGRRGSAEVFIEMAIDTAEYGELDLEIMEMDDRIRADFSFDLTRPLDALKEIIGEADEMYVFPGRGKDITFELEYFTKATYRNGELIAPIVFSGMLYDEST